MVANAARNTTFIDDLIASVREKGRSSFSEALALHKRTSSSHGLPKAGDVAKLLEAVPELFVVERVMKQYRLIDTTAAPLIFPITGRGADMERVADEGFRIVTSPGIRLDVNSPERKIGEVQEMQESVAFAKSGRRAGAREL